jgi:hypothetical protein
LNQNKNSKNPRLDILYYICFLHFNYLSCNFIGIAQFQSQFHPVNFESDQVKKRKKKQEPYCSYKLDGATKTSPITVVFVVFISESFFN